MEDIKFGIISLKDSVSSRKSGSAYLNSLVVNLENGNHSRIESIVRKVCLNSLTALKLKLSELK